MIPDTYLNPPRRDAADAARPPVQLVTFRLDQHNFAVPVEQVWRVEALADYPITRVPGAPEFLEGLINLRGRVIPVLDLKKRLGLAQPDTAAGQAAAVEKTSPAPAQATVSVPVVESAATAGLANPAGLAGPAVSAGPVGTAGPAVSAGTHYSPKARLLIVEMDLAGQKDEKVAMLVDTVNDIRWFAAAALYPPPPMLAGIGRQYLLGVLEEDAALWIVLELRQVLSLEERQALHGGASAAADAEATPG